MGLLNPDQPLPIPTPATTPTNRLIWRIRRIAWCASEVDALRYRKMDYPQRKTSLPVNVEFTIHRINEFMMLMLGETVLQLVIAPTEDVRPNVFDYTTLGAGFVICVCMMYTFNVTEPHDANHHVFRRSAIASILYKYLFTVKAWSVLMVGIGIKMCLYNSKVSGLRGAAGEGRCCRTLQPDQPVPRPLRVCMPYAWIV